MGMWEDILEFHRRFKIPQQRLPSIPDKEMCEFRIRFLEEEVDEFAQAIREGNSVEAFDALIDIVYVALGTAVIFNFPFSQGWDIVHAANMRKICKSSTMDGRHISDVVKPTGWVAPEKKLQSSLLDYEYTLQVGLPLKKKENE